MTTAPSLERWTIAGLGALLIAMLVAAGVSAFRLPVAAAVAIGLVAGALPLRAIARRLPAAWDGLGKRRPVLSALWLLLALLTLARTAGVAAFMIDPAQATVSAFGFDPFYIGHSCYSGYWQAAQLAQQGVPNLYDPALYDGQSHGIFRFDEFLYLPQFLLLPMLGVAAGGDFEQMRTGWFAIEGLALLASLVWIARWVGERAGRHAGLLLPAVWLSTPVLLTLQLGNFHLLAVALSAAAMALFWRERPVLGGALLGFAVFKLFPGILGIYLIATRRWKALGWTLAFSLLYTILTYLWLGDAPFRALLDFHLHRLGSGEAWAFLEQKELGFIAAINDSVPGVVYKLNALGVPGMSRALVQQVSWAWTLVVVALTVLAARRAPRMSRIELVATWVALLGLAATRSPFLPDHTGLFAPVWAWSLVAAGAAWNGRRAAFFALLWLVVAAVLPFTGTPLDQGDGRFIVSGISQAASLALLLWIVLRRPAGAGAADEVSAPFTPAAA
jgi:hypothetical protein